MLALYLFNTETAPFFGPSAFLTYSVTMSPRKDLLVVLHEGGAIENIVGRLVADIPESFEVAGLRVAASIEGRLSHLLHVPTGARMVIAEKIHFPTVADLTVGKSPHPHLAMPLGVVEQQGLHLASAMSPGIQQLLAGLAVRTSMKSPRDWIGA